MRRAFCSLLLAGFFVAPGFGQAPKKRIAILNFDYATVQNYVTELYGGNQDVGKGIADLLINSLVPDGVFIVVERKELDKVLAEQNFSNSDRADASTAAKIGKVLGVDAIVVGSITQFGRDDKHEGVGGGGYGLGKYGLGNLGVKKAKAVVVISARMVNTSTGEILAVANGKGESKRSGVTTGGGGGNWAGGGNGQLDMGSSNFGDTILGEAVHQAVDQMAKDLEQNAGKLPTNVVVLNGEVADVSGNTIIINIGSKAGVQVGAKLSVMHFVRAVKDPATGKILKKIENPVGDLTITEVDTDSATGTFTGAAVPKVGDSVHSGG